MAENENVNPQLDKETTSTSSEELQDPWKAFPWSDFRGYTKSQRAAATTSWIWDNGFDIELSADDSKRRWVCKVCVKLKKHPPHSTAATGTQNAEHHLFFEHRLWDPSGKRKPLAKVKDEKTSKNIAKYFKLDTHNAREQEIANAFISGFDRAVFQQLLIAWIADAQVSFRQAENRRLRDIFEYLNPLVSATEAHICHDTVRRRILQVYNTNKARIGMLLQQVPGKIHIAFDGWRSRNRHALYGITCFFLNEFDQPKKLVLGIPEVVERHSGDNIAIHVIDILEDYGVSEKVGYFTLDNASNNDTAMEAIGKALNFNGRARRVRCFGHIINLVVKALLFGHDAEAFEDEMESDSIVDSKRHEEWRRKGPIGKLHNFVLAIHKSDSLTALLRNLQQDFFDQIEDPNIRAKKPVDVVLDNLTRWLSQLYMIRRALRLRPFLEELWKKQRYEWDWDFKKSKRKEGDIPLYLQDESELTDKDWVVINLFAEVLQDFEDALLVLEGDGQFRPRKGGRMEAYGTIWDVLFGFEHLLEKLETWKATAERYPDPEHFRININLGWLKLNEYYERLDESPVYYTAVALHPAYRWDYFEHLWADAPEWVEEAKAKVKKLWLDEYKDMEISVSNNEEPLPKRRKTFATAFNRHREENRVKSSQSTPSPSHLSTTDEYVEWQRDRGARDDDVVDPIEYWHDKRSTYPRLAQMALDILSVAPMSAEVERLFSSAGKMLAPDRSRLEANTIGITQTVRSWLRAGYISTEEKLLHGPDEFSDDAMTVRQACIASRG